MTRKAIGRVFAVKSCSALLCFAAGLYHFLVGNSGKELYQTWMPDSECTGMMRMHLEGSKSTFIS